MMVSRRTLLQGGMLGGAAALTPAGVRMAFAATGASTANMIVFVLLRGGMDGLYMVAPSDDADLIAARPASLRLLASGTTPALPLAHGPSSNDWRLHPAAPEFKALYDAGHLAFVHAAGIPADSRSHFQMQAMLEHGVADPTLLTRTSGWIGQYANATGIASSTFAVISADSTLPASMSGDNEALSIANPKQFTLGSTPRSLFIQTAYGVADGAVAASGRIAIDAVNLFQRKSTGFVAPAAGTYANNAFGQGLSVIAETIKLDIGLQVAEVEYNDWDTHVAEQSRFANSASILSKGLGAFYNDIAAYANRVTIVVMSEFGRRVQSNASGGTDHGHGNVMMVLGGQVAGGRIYGTWPGLHPAVLDLGDVPVTTDYRSVLSEIITAARGAPPAAVFPGFTAGAALGLLTSQG
ncbi:MAG: DUF1501 domain-containing protein [Azospirillaceae bacterium]|nr:DUF1501 domain-containing protein [Azospirillaceae bacterium]